MRIARHIKVNHYAGRVVFVSEAALFLLAIVLCFPINNGEQGVQAANGTAQESSLTLAMERGTAALEVDVASTDGTFATSGEDDKAAFSVATNNYTGYTLSISALDDSGTLVDGDNVLNSITTSKTLTDATFDNSNYNGMWGYKPSKYMDDNTVIDNTGADAVYLSSPTTASTTLHVTNTANSTANSYDIALGARMDYSKPSGTYSKTFVLTAVANKINYSIKYNANADTDTVTNMPYASTDNIQSGDTSSTSITLSDLVPVREGFEFKGWCSVATSDETCSGTIYNPDGEGTNLEYGIDQTTIVDANIYAIWEWAACKGKTLLHDLVKCRAKDTQTAADLKAVITEPTSSNPLVDTSNSGVFEYNASEFGPASDASSDYPIYYYRGILDSDLDGTSSTYGSNGDGAYYPNYVKLGDTCWRIFRTTGSGGIKMIYNGLFSNGTTANSCANATTDANAMNAIAYNGGYRQIVRGGYTYNSTYAKNSNSSVAASTVFGNDANPGLNNTNSTAKNKLENTWFDGALSIYENILEPSAGYCNDRTFYNNTAPYTQIDETKKISTYGTSGLAYYNFGTTVRNAIENGVRLPTLGCPRSVVDLYTTAEAENGNKQLSKPAALLTVDEMSFSGSGKGDDDGGITESAYGSNYSFNTFLRSGADFWTMSPYSRYAAGNSSHSNYGNDGMIGHRNVDTVDPPYGLRPTISIKHDDAAIASGTGTALDPWVIEPSYAVHVAFPDYPGADVSFVDPFGNEQVVGPFDDDVNLKANVNYTITVRPRPGLVFSSWSSTDGILGSSTDNPTTYSITGSDTLSVHLTEVSKKTVSVQMDSRIQNVTFYNEFHGSQTVAASGETVELREGVDYEVSAVVAKDYKVDSWSATAGVIKSESENAMTYNTEDNAILTIRSVIDDRTLYGTISKMSKGTQTASELQAVITEPTSSDPLVDTSNSGVFEYNASEFGPASDASSDYAIYYYRGILDSNLDETVDTYGSNGDGAYYPNYVKLGDTCWRIFRTTGSGGVKMIYNGSFSGGTTANSCANATTNAQVTTKAFNGSSSSYHQAVRVGYRHNGTYDTNSNTNTVITTLFGSDDNVSRNNTNSTMKTYIEGTWFDGALSTYVDLLEGSAGFCGDRTMFIEYDPFDQVPETTKVASYGTSTKYYYFGAGIRNSVANIGELYHLTLGCPRSVVDLYTVAGAENGNKQLAKPVGLITADEVAFSGSGGGGRTQQSTYSSNYSYNSFLRSGSNYFTMSPCVRGGGGGAFECLVMADGRIKNDYYAGDAAGVRPVISIMPGVMITSGSGTALDPWSIE